MQMFVFGEVQDPNPDTVNLVEDIVRSQLIELVSTLSAIPKAPNSYTSITRLCKHEALLLDVTRGTSQQRT